MNDGTVQFSLLIDSMITLKRQMTHVGVEMMHSGHEKLMLHGDELIDAAAIVGSWVEWLREECEQ